MLHKFPKSLVYFSIAYLWLVGFSLWHPASMDVWIAEMTPVLSIFVIIWLVTLHFQFSLPAYLMMFVWLSMHTIGARYTFAEVPFDWFNQLIGSERNNFDRVAHYAIGFYAFPIAEYLLRTQRCGAIVASLFGLFSIMSLAAGYEIIEWWYAVLEGGDAGIAFLGSQGDIWDAQKDMLCDTLGALTSLILLPFAVKFHFWQSE